MTQVRQLPVVIKRKIPAAKVPFIYARAVTALRECENLNEAKYWNDAADALAAWAKIYQDDKASVAAKRLKLHAYRRMAELAEIIGHTKLDSKRGRLGEGRPRGIHRALADAGLSSSAAARARAIGQVPEPLFRKLVVQSKVPPGIQFLARVGVEHGPRKDVIQSRGQYDFYRRSHEFMKFVRQVDAKELARSIRIDEVPQARRRAIAMAEWLDCFEQYLSGRSI